MAFCLFSALIISLSVVSTQPLTFPHHNQDTVQQQQLDYLLGIQNSYAKQIKQLDSNISKVKSQLDNANNLDSKINILQTALRQERTKIGSMEYDLLPDSTSNNFECQFLTEQQRENYERKVISIGKQIEDLQALTFQIPECDQIDAIRQEIIQLKLYLERINNVIENSCEQYLIKSPTVYETNLKDNNNWGLGSMTMDDLYNQYYQRSLAYDNITNCPKAQPFYTSSTPTGSISQCIQCPPSAPYFDLSKLTCFQCNDPETLNLTTRQCAMSPSNTNYTYGQNYVLNPLPLLPLPNKNLSSCPPDRPFFNGTICIACPMPNKYWKVSESQCQSCPSGTIFDINMRQCMTQVNNKLTQLFGTQWVTNDGNVTRVLQQRLAIQQKNKTTGQYSVCPSMQPYYDQTACVYCPSNTQFNLDTLRCTQAAPPLKYDQNMRKYVVAQTNFEMDPKAPNYISLKNLTDNPNIPNCNATHPYFDTVSCIYCQHPFNIYDYDNSLCIACDPVQFYNQTLHKCVPRDWIYAKGNQNQLMATNGTSIQNYNATIAQFVRANPEKLPVQCSSPDEYAAITKCVRCGPSEYFNVQNYTCMMCDGSLDPVTRICRLKTYYLPNTEANNIIIPKNMTIQTLNEQIQQQLASNPRLAICPLPTPYPTANRTECIKCPSTTPYYNYTSQSCTICLMNQKYDNSTMKCRQITFLTNYDQGVLILPPNTLANELDKEAALNRTNLTQKCPPGSPFTSDHRLCFQCLNPQPIFNLSNGVCTSCPSPLAFDPNLNACKQAFYLTNLSAPKLLQADNYTVNNVRLQQQQLRSNPSVKYTDCSSTAPYGSLTGCVNCVDSSAYFNLKTLQCQKCQPYEQYWPTSRRCLTINNLTNINASTAKLVQDDVNTKAQLQEEINKMKQNGPTQLCPEATPYSANGTCVICPQSQPFYILATRNCGICNNYMPNTLTCPPKPYRYPNLSNYHWVTSNVDADQYVSDGLQLKKTPGAIECFAFYNPATRNCINCSANEVFNYDTMQCYQCPSGTLFDINVHTCTAPVPEGVYYTNIEESKSSRLLYGGLTLNELTGTQAELKAQYPDSQFCPDEKPYFDNIQCIMCPNYKKYFNLRYNLCQLCLFGETIDTVSHNCLDSNGAPIWQKPEGELVYPFLFEK